MLCAMLRTSGNQRWHRNSRKIAQFHLPLFLLTSHTRQNFICMKYHTYPGHFGAQSIWSGDEMERCSEEKSGGEI